MATIGQRTFAADGNQKYLSIGNEEFCRTLRVGNNWRHIRLMAQVALTPNGTSSITTARLTQGMQYSTIEGRTYNSANNLNYIGIMHGATTGVETGHTFTYDATTQPTYNSSFTQGVNRYQGSATIFTNTYGNSPYIATNTGLQRRSLLGLDVWRVGGPDGHATQLQVNWVSTNSVSAVIDSTNQILHESLANPAWFAPSIGTGCAASTYPPSPAPIGPLGSETTRPFDTYSIFWNKSAFPLEIYSIHVVRYY